MDINKNLSASRCWELVNRIQNGKTPEEIRERCKITGEWLTANVVISTEEYDDMMMTVAYMHRESYHIA